MISNAYEEVINPPKISIDSLHESAINNMKMPQWTLNLMCPYCHKHMSQVSIRSISIKTNARNIGDLCVEFLCPLCKVGNTLYFPKAAKTIEEYIKLLNGEKSPDVYPITEEDMYGKKYHNLLETQGEVS